MQKSVEIAENAHEWTPEKRVVNVGVAQLGASVTGEMVDHVRQALARLSVVINILGIGDWGRGGTDTDGIDPRATPRKQGWVALAERVFSLVSVPRHRIHRLDERNVFGWHFVLVMVMAWICGVTKEEDGRLREFFWGGAGLV